MITERDPDLVAAYARLAQQTEPPVDPTPAVGRRVRTRRRRRTGVRVALAACAAVLVTTGAVQVISLAPPTDPGASGATGPRSGALPDHGSGGCAFEYNRTTLADRAWAADATVTSIGAGRTNIVVTFAVNEWFRGGDGTDLEVLMRAPQTSYGPPDFTVGSRLLVSGELSDTAVRDHVVWTCGFTRYWNARTAAVWADVFR